MYSNNVIPAYAGIQSLGERLDARVRGHDVASAVCGHTRVHHTLFSAGIA